MPFSDIAAEAHRDVFAAMAATVTYYPVRAGRDPIPDVFCMEPSLVPNDSDGELGESRLTFVWQASFLAEQIGKNIDIGDQFVFQNGAREGEKWTISNVPFFQEVPEEINAHVSQNPTTGGQ